jgi:hypothetical protein
MRSRFEDKRWGLVLAFLALVSLFLLVGALRTMDFRPAQPIGSSRDSNARSIDISTIVSLLGEAAEVPFWRQIAFWSGLFLIVLLISSLLSPELRKQLIKTFLRFASFAIILLYVIKNNPDILAKLVLKLPVFSETMVASPGQEIAPPVFQSPQIPSLLSFFVTFTLILLGIVLLWTLTRWWKKQKELFSARQSLREIADITHISLKDLESGGDSNDAIIQCYDRMSNVVVAKRGLHRGYSMTPAEFATGLERVGLPREPVNRLTRLFESVRYGGHVSSTPEIDEAVACLTSILKYCGETY